MACFAATLLAALAQQAAGYGMRTRPAARSVLLDVGAGQRDSASAQPSGEEFLRMLKSRGAHGTFDSFKDRGIRLPWSGMVWRGVLGGGGLATVFDVDLGNATGACSGVPLALKVSKRSHDPFSLKDPCIAHAFGRTADAGQAAPPVPRVLDVRSFEGHAYVLMERARMNLFVWSSLNKDTASPALFATQLRILHEILLGVQSMHGAGFVHCDIKLENVMLEQGDSEGQWDVHVALIDFDFVRPVNNPNNFPARYTPAYASPDYIWTDKCRRDTDIWAVGVIFSYLMFREHPGLQRKEYGPTPEGFASHVLRSARQHAVARMTKLSGLEHVPEDTKQGLSQTIEALVGDLLGRTDSGKPKPVFKARVRESALDSVVTRAGHLAEQVATALGMEKAAPQSARDVGSACAEQAQALPPASGEKRPEVLRDRVWDCRDFEDPGSGEW